jgi:cytochrome d ubiquinol oxidase subunit II
MVMFWAVLLAVSILLYVLLDGFDLGVGNIYGYLRSRTSRPSPISGATIAPRLKFFAPVRLRD